jgi:hypothetical protein
VAGAALLVPHPGDGLAQVLLQPAAPDPQGAPTAARPFCSGRAQGPRWRPRLAVKTGHEGCGRCNIR